MYLRYHKRLKDGKEHRSWSGVHQRQLLYLGELNDCQQAVAGWRWSCGSNTSCSPIVEQAFKELKNDLDIRPVYHQKDDQIAEAKRR